MFRPLKLHWFLIKKKHTHVKNGHFSDIQNDNDMPFIAAKV